MPALCTAPSVDLFKNINFAPRPRGTACAELRKYQKCLLSYKVHAGMYTKVEEISEKYRKYRKKLKKKNSLNEEIE